MSNNSTAVAYVKYTQLHPLFTAALASASEYLNSIHEGRNLILNTSSSLNYELNNNNNNDTSDSVLLLIEDENYLPSTTNYRPTSNMVVICMISAWVMLIFSVSICCFTQCGVSKRTQHLSNGRSGNVGVRQRPQQQRNGRDRTNPEPVELCRHFPPDYEAESLPSYTIVSGLPTYDAALEEFRKASIILTPPIPMVKIFEKDALNPNNTPIKDNHVFNIENELNPNNNDNISVTSTSTCTCGAANANVTNSTNPNSNALLTTSSEFQQNMLTSQVIELSPEQLAALSRKRLSLQISFNNGLQRNSRRGIDLYRQVNRNNMLRSQAVAAAAAAIAATAAANTATAANDSLPRIHRSSSSLSLSNEPQMLDQRLVQHLQHRGSLY